MNIPVGKKSAKKTAKKNSNKKPAAKKPNLSMAKALITGGC